MASYAGDLCGGRAQQAHPQSPPFSIRHIAGMGSTFAFSCIITYGFTDNAAPNRTAAIAAAAAGSVSVVSGVAAVAAAAAGSVSSVSGVAAIAAAAAGCVSGVSCAAAAFDEAEPPQSTQAFVCERLRSSEQRLDDEDEDRTSPSASISAVAAQRCNCITQQPEAKDSSPSAFIRAVALLSL